MDFDLHKSIFAGLHGGQSNSQSDSSSDSESSTPTRPPSPVKTRPIPNFSAEQQRSSQSESSEENSPSDDEITHRNVSREGISRNHIAVPSQDQLTQSDPDTSKSPPCSDLNSGAIRSYGDDSDMASSDAETIKPDSSTPPSPSPDARRQDDSSADESAETLPPPSPGGTKNINTTVEIQPQRSPSPRKLNSRPMIIEIDERGIDGWEEDCKNKFSWSKSGFSNLKEQYPKLDENSVRFRIEDNEGIDLADENLSDLQSNNKKQPPFGTLPSSIVRYLSPYQKDGITFMYRLYERGRGGLLADAMGLGKTVQAVCFIGAAFAVWDQEVTQSRAEGGNPPIRVLVVAPATLRENWKRELQTWTPLRIGEYESNNEGILRRKMQENAIDVIVTGDKMLGEKFFQNPQNLESPKQWKWDIVIVDEIHNAKNSNTKYFKSLASLPRKVMFGLTGTAFQNRLKELWNIMSLVVPSSLWPSDKDFKMKFVNPITKGTKQDAYPSMRHLANKRIKLLRELLGKHMVRRPKSILELPEKTDYCVLMRMKRNGLQGYMYQRFQSSYDVKLLRDARKVCDCNSPSGETSQNCCHRFPSTPENLANAPIWRMVHEDSKPCKNCPQCLCLHLQHYSRFLAAHAILVMPDEQDSNQEKAVKRRELFRYYLGEHGEKASDPTVLLEQRADVSCKLDVALRLLKAFESKGHKTIIFYESLRLGNMLQRWATNNGLAYEVIDGAVAKSRRQGAVDRFNKNSLCSIFFISKKAGATGLNIVGADRVLIFEPCWNPTLDLQAGDRAHRLGQKRNVQIIRLVVENTIEHYVFKTAVSKVQVVNAVLDNTREEWLIKANELGSMAAMLSMGDAFTEEMNLNEIEVFEASNLNKTEKLKGECGTKTDDDKIRKGSSEKESVSDINVLGDEIICSLNVDFDGNIELGSQENNSEDEDQRNKRDNRYEESQLETDLVLNQGGASRKMVVTSTHKDKKKQQMMGQSSTGDVSGINAHGPSGVNFDDAKWDGNSNSASVNETDTDDEIRIMRKRMRTTPIENETKRKSKRLKDSRETYKKSNETVNRKPTRLATSTKQNASSSNSNNTKGIKSAFAARARVRAKK